MTTNNPQWQNANAGQPVSSQPDHPQLAQMSSRPSDNLTAAGSTGDRPVTFRGILEAFRRRWIPALAVAVPAALLVGALMWQTIPAQYESSALLKVKQYEDHLINDDFGSRGSEFIMYRDSQINFLKSRPVLTSAMRVDGVKESRLMRDKTHPVEWLEENLDVNFDFSAEFIRLTLSGEYPEDLAIVVNAVKDVYLDEVVYNHQNERIKTLRTLETKFATLDKSVRKNQERIDRLAEDLGTNDSKAALGNQDLEQMVLRGLQQDLQALNTQIREEEATRAYMRDRGIPLDQMRNAMPSIGLGNGSGPLVANPGNGQEAQMRRQLQALQYKIRQFRDSVRNQNHPELLALMQQERALKNLVEGQMNPTVPGGPNLTMSKYDWLLKQKEQIEGDVKAGKERLEINARRLVELEREKQDIQHLVKTRDDLALNIQSRGIELDRPKRVTVVQDANVPEKRNVKSRTQAAFIGGFGTLFTIIAGFTMFEWFSHRVGSTSDIANAINLRLIGAIPSPDKGGILGLGIFAGKVDYDEWNRAVIESMDVVRTYLMRHVDPTRSASILVTSASANEGKTTVSCQLAASLARAGKRVAIVDCDFRRPSAHMMMDGAEGPGICEYLRGEASLKEVCQTTQADGLHFISAGQIDQSVLQKLSADGGRSLIELLKKHFDFVIIDTSPLLFVAEPSMLAQNADIVLLSTRKDYSRIPYVAQCRDSLRSLQVPLLGAVMVGSDSDFQRQTYGYRQEIQKSAQHRAMSNS